MQISSVRVSSTPERRSRFLARSRSSFALCAALLLVLGAGGCQESVPERPAEPPRSAEEYEGLSREEIERRASSMTPEEAERLGIVDTTIRIEPPMDPDSVLPSGFGVGVGGASTEELSDEP